MKTPKSKSLHQALAALLMVFAAAFLFSACKNSEAETVTAKRPRPVKAIQLEAYTSHKNLTFPGTAKAKREVDLSFRVGGPLEALKVETGQFVNKGDAVARIDSRDFSLRVKTMKASLAASQATLAEAELQFERYSGLMKENAAAKATYDQVKAAFEVAQARVDADRQALADAMNALDDTILAAPFSGFVDKEYVENHETVAPGQPIVSLVDLSTLEVELALPATALPLLDEFVDYTCSFDAMPGMSFQAQFKEIAKQPNLSNTSYPLTLILAQTETNTLPIHPGMSGEVSIIMEGESGPMSFLIPPGAVVNGSDHQSYVFVLNSAQNRVNKMPVTLGDLTAHGLSIQGELDQGQWIVSAGLSFIQEGQEVRLLPAPSSTNIGKEL